MIFKIWLIYSRISRKIKLICNSRHLYCIRNNLLFSLLINIIIMTGFVFGIIRFLFLFSPSEANLYFSNEVNDLEFTAISVSGMLETDSIILQVENYSKILLHNFCIDYDNKKYDNIKYIALYMNEKSFSSSIEIKRKNDLPISAFLGDPSLIIDKENVRYFDKTITLNNGILLAGIDDGEYKVRITGATIKAFDTNDKEIFSTNKFNIIQNKDIYGSSYIITHKKTSLIPPNVMRTYNERPATNHFLADFEGIDDITFVGTGELFFL